jgi:hypothetical protein
MVGQVFPEPAGAADRDRKYRAEDGVDGAAKALQHGVVCRVQDREMERLVRDEGARLILGRLHRRQRRIDAQTVVPGGALRGERCCCRLDDRAHLLDRQQQVSVRLVLADQPA